jgi:hypothetical protein
MLLVSQGRRGVDYKATLWRKALERRGWKRLDKYKLPNDLIDFHVIHRGKLYSGRCIGAHPVGDFTQPRSSAYVIGRRDLMTEGVWRLSSGGQIGMNARELPYSPDA